MSGGATSFLVATTGLALGFVTHVLLSRALGVSAYGTYAVGLGWCMILATPATAGLDNTVLRCAPMYFGAGDIAALRRLIRFSARVLALSGFVSSIALFVLRGIYPEALARSGIADVAWMTVIVAATAALTAFSAFFRACQKIFFFQFYQQVLRATVLVALIAVPLVLGVGLTASDALAATALAAMVALAALAVHLHRTIGPGADDEASTADVSTWSSLAGASFLIATLQQTQVQSNVVLLAIFSTPEEAGVYSAASRLSVFVTFGLSALASITAPMIVHAWEARDRPTLAKIAAVNARLATVGALAIAAVFVFAGDRVLLLFGASFGEAYGPLLILLAGGVFNAFTGACANLLLMTGNQWSVLKVRVVSLCIFLIAAAVAIPRYGAVGAAAAFTIEVLVSNTVMTWLVRRAIGVDATALGVRLALVDAR